MCQLQTVCNGDDSIATAGRRAWFGALCFLATASAMDPCLSSASVHPEAARRAISLRFGTSGADAPSEWKSQQIEHVHNVAYGKFWEEFMVRNHPVLLCGETEKWRARSEWVRGATTECAPGSRAASERQMAPNFERLAADFGEEEVCVAICGEKHFSDQKREEVRMVQFLEEWQALEADPISVCDVPSKTMPEHATESTEPAHTDADDDLQRPEHAWVERTKAGGRLPYCKDWHFAHRFRDYGGYTLPVHFSEDWLNAYYDAHPELGDDYRFCYLGPAGSWTPFHRDVLRSYSWSANVVGRKLWILFPPEQDHLLRDSHGNLPWDVTAPVDSARFPRLHHASPLRVLQRQGEILFVPSGWLHQVLNLDDCISLNHNWLNSCNVHHAVAQMLDDHRDVTRSIANCKDDPDFVVICEQLLKAHAGMNLAGFHSLLVFCCNNELKTSAELRRDLAPSVASEMHEGEGEGAALGLVFRLLAVREALDRFEEEEHVRLLANRGVLPHTRFDLDGGASHLVREEIRNLEIAWPEPWRPFPPEATVNAQLAPSAPW